MAEIWLQVTRIRGWVAQDWEWTAENGRIDKDACGCGAHQETGGEPSRPKKNKWGSVSPTKSVESALNGWKLKSLLGTFLQAGHGIGLTLLRSTGMVYWGGTWGIWDGSKPMSFPMHGGIHIYYQLFWCEGPIWEPGLDPCWHPPRELWDPAIMTKRCCMNCMGEACSMSEIWSFLSWHWRVRSASAALSFLILVLSCWQFSS